MVKKINMICGSYISYFINKAWNRSILPFILFSMEVRYVIYEIQDAVLGFGKVCHAVTSVSANVSYLTSLCLNLIQP